MPYRLAALAMRSPKFMQAWSVVVTAALVVAALGGLWVFVLDTPTPVYYTNIPFPVDKAVYHAGDDVGIIASVCVNAVNLPSIGRLRVASTTNSYVLPVRYSQTPAQKGCATAQTPSSLPDQMTPGVYHIEALRSIQVNQFLAAYRRLAYAELRRRASRVEEAPTLRG